METTTWIASINDIFKQQLGPTLRRLREDIGITLIALAKAINMAKSSLSKIEAGRNQPTPESLISILWALNITKPEVDILILLENRPENLPQELYNQLQAIQTEFTNIRNTNAWINHKTEIN